MSLPDDLDGLPRPPELDEPQPEMADDAAPPVVAVVVTRNPGPFLEATLAGLRDQDYPDLSVLVMDAGSTVDPGPRVVAVLPDAYTHRGPVGRPGFGGAANQAFGLVQGATFLLACHDDVALAPDAVRILVEEAYRSNAAIVGPKLVSAEDPEVLLEVGRSIDRLGGSHTGIEPGELDQEQHDAVRDVFYVSSAALLVRADLFAQLGGFDADTFPGSEDLDLCWRARLAGARIVVAPDARGAHVEAALERQPGDAPTAREIARRRVRVVLTCYSLPSLLRAIPLGVGLALLEAVVFAPTPRRRQAAAVLGAWRWNLLRLGRVRRARRQAQAGRAIHDRDLRELQVGASARVGAFLSQHHADERIESLEDRVRDSIESASTTLVHPASLALIVFAAIVALGSRDYFTSGVPAIGSFVMWPGVRALAGAFTSSWRYTGLGSTAAAPPVLALMAGLGTILAGSVGLAQALLVTLAIPVGALGALRVARHVGADRSGMITAGLAYGVSAVPRNDLATGQLGPLVLFALLPFLALLVIRAGRFDAPGTPGRRQLLGLAIGTAVASAWFPPAALVVIVAALAWCVAALFVGGAPAALRGLGATLVGAAGAAVLLIPWTGTAAHGVRDPGAFGFTLHPHVELSQLVRFHTGPAGAGIAGYGLLAAAALGLLVATGPRFAWVVRAWALILAAWVAVLLPARFAPGIAVPPPEAVLSLGALGIALAAGLAVASRPSNRIGWRRLGAVVVIAGVVLGGLGFAADALDGRWQSPSNSWPAELAFTRDLQYQGQFRVLWIGDPSVLPLAPVPLGGGVAYTLTRDGPGDSRELLAAPLTHADRVLGAAITDALAGRTARLGRLLAPMGIRYVAFPQLNGPGGVAGPPLPGVGAALGNQLDFARLGSDPGLELYQNEAWFPGQTVVAARRGPVPTRPASPQRAATSLDLSTSRSLGSSPASPGTVLWFEAYDPVWQAHAGGTTLPHQPAFGVTNQFRLSTRAAVTISHTGQTKRYGLVGIEVLLWLFALAWWARGRRRSAASEERDARRVAARIAREERRRGSADPMESDVEFWEQG